MGKNTAAKGNKAFANSAAHGKKKRVTAWIIVLALAFGIAGISAYFLLPKLTKGLEAYELLKDYAGKKELTMELFVEADIGGQTLDFSALIDRTQFEGTSITGISQNGLTLFYADGTVLLENGKAFKLSGSSPDYSRLLGQAAQLYQYADITVKNDVYTITVHDKDAEKLLELLVPSAASGLSGTNEIMVEMVKEGDELSEIRFSGGAALDNSERTPFSISAVLRTCGAEQKRIKIPQAVKEAVRSGSHETMDALYDDLIRLVSAWNEMNERNPLSATLSLNADCGPLVLDESFQFLQWTEDGTKISSVRQNDYALYFSGNAVCDKNGNIISAGDFSVEEAARLPEIIYALCMDGDFGCQEVNGEYIYTLSLDEDGMKNVIYAIAPETEKTDIRFESGSIRISLREDKIQYIQIVCQGTMDAILAEMDVTLGAKLELSEEPVSETIPSEVRRALVSRRLDAMSNTLNSRGHELPVAA